MENLSHSRQPNRGSASLSKKIFNGNDNGGGFAAKTLYDDVYGGPPKFGVSSLSPRAEDYSEIFGNFHVSRAPSIPILNLPPVDETEVFFDVRSSPFDYTEVFGGFDCLDSALTYEELINQSKDVDGDSSEEAWTPAGTESLSDDSDHSEKNQCMFTEDFNQDDGSTEFSISYSKANQIFQENMSNGTTHVAQLHTVPGFSYLINGVDTLPKTDDGYLNMDFSVGKVKGKHLQKITPSSSSNSGEQTFEGTPKGCDGNSSHPNKSFVTVSDVSLRTQPSQVPPPSRLPPMVDVKRGDHAGFASNYKVASSEGTSSGSSPPFFDVEIDSNSSAATSAAVMKEVMEKARVKLQSAKELMEKKKEGVHTHSKPHLKHNMKGKEGKRSMMLDQFSKGKYDKVQGTYELDDNEMKFPVRKSPKDKSRNEPNDDAGGQKEATGFFELRRPDKSRESSHVHEWIGKGTVVEALDQLQKINNEVNAVEKAHRRKDQLREINKKVNAVKKADGLKDQEKLGKQVCRQEKDDMISVSANVAIIRVLEKSRVAQHFCVEENENKCRMAQPSIETEMQLTGADKLKQCEELVKVKNIKNKGESEQTTAYKHEQKKKEVNNGKHNENKLQEAHWRKDSEKRQKEAIDHGQIGEICQDAFEMKEVENRLKEAPVEEEIQKRRADALQLKENMKRQKEASEREEIERRLKEYEKRLKDGRERKERVGIHKQADEQQDKRNNLKEVQDIEAREIRFTEVVEHVETENSSENADGCSQGEMKNISQVYGGIENNINCRKVKPARGAQMQMAVEHSKGSVGACQVDDKRQATELPCKHDEDERTMKVTVEVLAQKVNGVVVMEDKGCQKQLDGAETENLKVDENFITSGMGQKEVKPKIYHVKMEDSYKSDPLDDNADNEGVKINTETNCSEKEAEEVEMEDMLIDKNVKTSTVTQGYEELVENQCGIRDAKESLHVDENEKKVGGVGPNSGTTRLVKMKSASNTDHQDLKFDHETGEEGNALNAEKDDDINMTTHVVKEGAEKGRETEATQRPMSEGKTNSQKIASKVSASQFSEAKAKTLNETHSSGEKETDRLRREKELENDLLRKLEEEREREREREKDRKTVDKTMLEAHERANSEANERAALERAIAEARQRAMVDARERLEKACAEAREKSLSGKTAMEARIRAERVAVERATAEARERAAGKAMAERAAFEARERVERSIPDKLSTSFRNIGTRQSSSSSDLPDLQSHNMGPFSGTRYTYSPGYDEGIEGESAQRCKARLERYRRTAERAANALAEKNKRDLLAQIEQAERNRLAESLDADVKRWSSGKEGNLRALLSTLQYILGPDSGWQPIPLTEVITAAAVKKAYRKATLCVHPDKLQQRSASIQQKYICEKVFDLLKEAWNKFNSEER